MSTELLSALFKRKSQVETGGQTWESAPEQSNADASAHLQGLKFDAPAVQDWLQQLDITPEEDMLAQALADGLAERRGEGMPEHVIAAGDRRLQELAAKLAEMQRAFAEERESLGSRCEELERREAEIRAREEGVEAEKQAQKVREEARKNYPQPKWLTHLEGTINIGVVGNSGVGKSLFINKLRKVRPQAHGWAPVGVNETTREPTMYPFPGQPEVRIWDLPGAGTEAVPSATYVQDMGLRYFDKVLILTAGRFTSMDVELRNELEQHKVPYYMVRTKVDIDVWNNKEDNGADQKTTIAQIREDLKSNHPEGTSYLVSSRDPESLDMPVLVMELFPSMKRQLDADAPSFVPTAPAWNGAWAMPVVFSATLQGMQGRWRDGYSANYLLQGNQVHVSLQQGQRALVPLTERDGRVWWCNRWFVSEEAVKTARRKAELRWAPTQPGDQPLIWWWAD
mmetsp:Transcript_56505/g.160203  ORF Transcript_56505/g.160203 Transcript_56505/m.160203 type:complete len:454 (-) Transcript_56505:137-1498(-)|eukprot:CAMPEP_0177248952 /NCGR_PEP_ID=MMETSP0367-20130122/52477_1 /TAXON_ID=447022 ORGANISM="Scrippsiella hangoei-like, Strain SHHI-4" /NCGR_SAMPLE_ID=MMETSP0367 /ASSEMBLY_ACC=CAM_ASM_000362 /LENGTH=453 /DNA_ID=CAMNT_0018701393 /DNA_START=143 /DNA_END=1504 /DNA_ORIENTATION=-